MVETSPIVTRTRYIYDDFGLLRCVMSPRAIAPDTSNIELCYYYNYDARKRLIEKKVPGAAWVHYIYDNRDRLVMWWDGLEGGRGGDDYIWNYILYDAMNRPVVKGLLGRRATVSTVRNSFYNHYNNPDNTAFETFDSTGALLGYSGNSFPSNYQPNEASIQTVTWYDNYQFKSLPRVGNTNYEYPDGRITGIWIPSSPRSDARGLVTGTLESFGTPSAGNLVSVMYYDDHLRVVCTNSDNHLSGFDLNLVQYSFNHEMVKTLTIHSSSNLKADLTITQGFEYDHTGRILKETHKVNNNPTIDLKTYNYNQLGEVINTGLHKTGSDSFAQSVDYVYNIRGWLRRINNPANQANKLFSMELIYETHPTVSRRRFNGNISRASWRHLNESIKGYNFVYDGLNRLTSATYGEGTNLTSNTNRFNTTYGYDLNGNINSLTRRHSNTVIDNLGYTYTSGSNRLRRVSDSSGNPAGYAAVAADYLYDTRGNMTTDPSKQTMITYNHLNLPNSVQFGTNQNDRIDYTFTANGRKLRKEVNHSSNIDSQTDYSGVFLYEDGELISIFTPAGRVLPMANNGWQYEYNLTDHLGNVRAVFAVNQQGQAVLQQKTDYYPFGMVMTQSNPGTSPENKLLYNSKEIQDDVVAGKKLDWYDYGARFYDAQIGRWHVVDPHAENYYPISTYAYVANNPIIRIDPDGRDIWEINDEGKIVQRIKDKSQDAFYMVAKDGNGEYQRTYTTNAEGEKEYNSIAFEYGTVESQRTIAINSTSSYDVYQVRGDDNGTALFNFMSHNVTGSPSQVEFSQAMTGFAGDKGLNFITTSHEPRRESGMTYLLNGQLLNGYTIRELNHSHPVGRTPSGSDVPGNLSGDLGFAKQVKDRLRANGHSIPLFHIYHVPSRTKTPYAQ